MNRRAVYLRICSHGSRHYNNEQIAMIFLRRVISSRVAKTWFLAISTFFLLVSLLINRSLTSLTISLYYANRPRNNYHVFPERHSLHCHFENECVFVISHLSPLSLLHSKSRLFVAFWVFIIKLYMVL